MWDRRHRLPIFLQVYTHTEIVEAGGWNPVVHLHRGDRKREGCWRVREEGSLEGQWEGARGQGPWWEGLVVRRDPVRRKAGELGPVGGQRAGERVGCRLWELRAVVSPCQV